MVIDVDDAETDIAKLMERVASGEELVLGRAGRPVARLVPYAIPRQPRQTGRLSGRVWAAPDFVETPARTIADFEGEDAGSS